ncbi:MAG TPA: folylpolyglutamate synthase/dihydrofolate synthase family protein, partial [Oscillospiraceae bacterium]|nr:folylpolyglutamate synthase/dihydrofolate synthase family protein [Oscillospiraceae bacterium]
MKYEEALNWIHGLYRFGSNLGLERVTKLMELLDNPQDKFRSVHVAGTNGKGSTAAFLAQILQAEGLSVGLYTSPYIEAFTNRMALNGHDIGEAELVELVKQVKWAVDELAASAIGQPTEFEVVTALAFTYFAQNAPDWVVVEVGLGGRLDATNVITPTVSVITNIALDHTDVLGGTIAAIAGEKAGIIKPGVPVVTGAQKDEALAVFQQVAAERQSPLYAIDHDFTEEVTASSLAGLTFSYQSPWHQLSDLQVQLLGRHQARNASVAIAARELLPLPFSEEAVREGLRKTMWPGRLEVFSQQPLVMVDGAHNPDGVLALRSALLELLGDRKLRLVIGILGDKAVEEIVGVIAPLAQAGIIVTTPNNPRAADPYVVAELVRKFAGNTPVEVVPEIQAAVQQAVAITQPNEALCVSGSLYTISEAREVLKNIY